MKLRTLALAWATEILGEHWPHERCRLEVDRERLRVHRSLGRQLYSVEVLVWELAGTVELERSPEGGVARCRFPAEPEGPTEAVSLDEGETLAAVAAATSSVADRLQVRDARRGLGRDGSRVFVRVDRLPPDGRMTLELDPADGARVSYHCLPFQRGSRRSAALSRASAFRRARDQVELPDGVRLAHSRLSRSDVGRLWTFRWERRGEGGLEWVKASINARSGRLVAWAHVRRRDPAVEEQDAVDRRTAEAHLARAARVRLGAALLLGAPVPGVVRRGERRLRGWLAVAHTPRGYYRLTFAAGTVTFAKQARPAQGPGSRPA